MSRYTKCLQDRGLRAALIGAAIVAQLHLFLVVELHHHGVQVPLSGGQGEVSAQLRQWHSSPEPDPICSACRVSRLGAVQLNSATPLPSPSYSSRKLLLSEAPQFAWRFPSRLSSRAPPLS